MLSVVSAPAEKVSSLLEIVEAIHNPEMLKQILREMKELQDRNQVLKEEGELAFAQAKALHGSFKGDLEQLREDQKELSEQRQALRLAQMNLDSRQKDFAKEKEVFGEEKQKLEANLVSSIDAANKSNAEFKKALLEVQEELESAKNLKAEYEGKLEKMKALVG